MNKNAKITCLKASRKLLDAVYKSSSDELYFSYRLDGISREIFGLVCMLENRVPSHYE